MLTCLPLYLCSGDYRIEGLASGLEGQVFWSTFTESGGIHLDGETFAIRKPSWLSSDWTMELEGRVVAESTKPNPFTRRIEIAAGGLSLVLKPQSTFTSAFDIIVNDTVVGSIQRMHPFTRRATLECDPLVPESVQLFCFWHVALLWRRADN